MEFVRRAATRFASRPAIATTIVSEGGGEISSSQWVDYGALVRRAERVAASLPAATSRASQQCISTPAGNAALVGPRIGVWAQPGPEFVASLYACYLSGSVAVPLSPTQPQALLERALEDCGASALLAPERVFSLSSMSSPASSSSSPSARLLLEALSAARKIPLVAVEDVERMAASVVAAEEDDEGEDEEEEDGDNNYGSNDSPAAALILYTSGSTGRPKGVVHSASSLLSQADVLSRAWRVRPRDAVLHALPLNHVHGLVNALLSPLASGARVRFLLPRFSAKGVWRALAAEAEADGDDHDDDRRLVFHGVPTMYSMMLDELEAGRRRRATGEEEEEEDGDDDAATRRGLAAARYRARLFVCGSAACPPPLWQRWRRETGHALLERYGMTETGMILSNPVGDEARRGGGGGGGEGLATVAAAAEAQVRRPGTVGLPLPGVDVRLVPLVGDAVESSGGGGSDRSQLTIAEALALEERQQREQEQEADGARRQDEPYYALRVRGPSLFSGYWCRDDATREAFPGDGDGFFDTGDVVAFDRGGGGEGEGGGGSSSSTSSSSSPRYLRVVGRASADVIKIHGVKLSGLDIESALLQLQQGARKAGAEVAAAAASPALVSECAVFGVPDARFEGEELVVALVRLSPAAFAEAQAQQEGAAAAAAAADAADAAASALARRLAALVAPCAVPKAWLLLPPDRAIPRNAMGKVNKRALRAALFAGGAGGEPGARWVAPEELLLESDG